MKLAPPIFNTFLRHCFLAAFFTAQLREAPSTDGAIFPMGLGPAVAQVGAAEQHCKNGWASVGAGASRAWASGAGASSGAGGAGGSGGAGASRAGASSGTGGSSGAGGSGGAGARAATLTYAWAKIFKIYKLQ